MLFAEWFGNMVKVYDEKRSLQRTYHVEDSVVSVQCYGEKGDQNARVAITMANGRTRLYDGNGSLIR